MRKEWQMMGYVTALQKSTQLPKGWGTFAANLAENVLTGGVGVADDALCYSAIAAMILAVVGTEKVQEMEDCEQMN